MLNFASVVFTLLARSASRFGAEVVLWLDPHVHKSGAVLGDALQKAGCASSEWADTGGCGCSGQGACGYATPVHPSIQTHCYSLCCCLCDYLSV